MLSKVAYQDAKNTPRMWHHFCYQSEWGIMERKVRVNQHFGNDLWLIQKNYHHPAGYPRKGGVDKLIAAPM